MDTLKGVGRIYQQTFIDTYAKVGFAKLYDRKTPITAADLLNDRVIPFFATIDAWGSAPLPPLQVRPTDRSPRRRELQGRLSETGAPWNRS